MLGIIPAGLSESREVRHRRSEQVEAILADMDKRTGLFQHLELANDGGLDEEVSHLYNHGRVIGSISNLVLIVLNICTIMRADLYILRQDAETVVDRLNLTEIILKSAGLRSLYVAEQLVAFFELTVLFVLISLAFFYMLNGLFRGKRFTRWLCTARLFSEVLPELKIFSAMRLLHHVQPYLAQREFKAMLADVRDRRAQGEPTIRLAAELAVWVAMRVLIFIFGFDAFIVKFRVAAECASQACFLSFLRTVLFLNQMLGVVSLERFTHKRLHHFVFGGEDNIISAGEERLLVAWTVKLFERIWTEPSNDPVRAFAVSLTFNDEDFQRLMLNERLIRVPTPQDETPTENGVTYPSAVKSTPTQVQGGRVDELRRLWQPPAEPEEVPVPVPPVPKRSKTEPVVVWRSRKATMLPAPVVPPERLGSLL